MGKKWKRILRLRRNAAHEAVEETPAPTPAKVVTKAPEVVVEESEETVAEEVVAETPKLSKTKKHTTSAKGTKKPKSSKTTKRTTKSK